MYDFDTEEEVLREMGATLNALRDSGYVPLADPLAGAWTVIHGLPPNHDLTRQLVDQFTTLVSVGYLRQADGDLARGTITYRRDTLERERLEW